MNRLVVRCPMELISLLIVNLVTIVTPLMTLAQKNSSRHRVLHQGIILTNNRTIHSRIISLCEDPTPEKLLTEVCMVWQKVSIYSSLKLQVRCNLSKTTSLFLKLKIRSKKMEINFRLQILQNRTQYQPQALMKSKRKPTFLMRKKTRKY